MTAHDLSYRELFDRVPIPQLVASADGRVHAANPALCRLLGRSHDDVVGADLLELCVPDDRLVLAEHLVALRRAGAVDDIEVGLARGDERVAVLLTLARLTPVGGTGDATSDAIVAIAHDVGEHRAVEAALRASTHDAVTGLPNRARLVDAVRSAVGRGRLAAVVLLHLDRFRMVVDAHGHAVGDEVLRAIGALLESAVGPGWLVARVGGDEFAVACHDLGDEREALDVAERLRAVLRVPFRSSGHIFHVSPSIGVTVTGDAGASAGDVLAEAEIAMRRARERGGGRTEVFDADLHARVLHRVELEEALRAGIESGELVVHYQPEIDLHTGQLLGMEALVRWDRDGTGLVPPAEFVGVAEETDLIVLLGAHVLFEACARAARWRAEHPEIALCVSVNLSARQLADEGLTDTVAAALASSGLDPASLCLEITETVLMHDAAEATARLRALKALGVRLAIDDFGTGYSSLSYLKRFPVDFLKVDRSFVAGLGRSMEDTAIVEAVVRLADTLGLEVVAEGVETRRQLEELRRLGCRFAQGALWSMPLAPDDVPQLLAAHVAGSGPVTQAAPSGTGRDAETGAGGASPTAERDAVSVLSHELRLPVALLRSYTEALPAALPDEAATMVAVEGIDRQVAAIASLLDLLGDLRELEAGTLVVRPEPVSLGGFVGRVVEEGRSRWPDTLVEVVVDHDARVAVDPFRARQVLTNLLDNAARFSPQGEPVVVRVAAGDHGATVRVIDRGPGVPPAQVGEIFRKFGRGDRSTKGTGLGLYIARGLARAHGGDLTYRWAEGGGAELVLTLPSADA